MSSKYDAYWENRATELINLIEMAAHGHFAQTDVSDIRPLGDRRSWYGRVLVRSNNVTGGTMAHATSLGRTVARLGLCDQHPDKVFVFTITQALGLTVATEGIVQTGVKERPKSSGAPNQATAQMDVGRTLDATGICGRVHKLLERLPLLSSPDEVKFLDGLYFFYEQAELSAHGNGDRIVRVGNHPRSEHRLRGRLEDHYDVANRRDAKNWSVFRRYLGGALLRRHNPLSPCLGEKPGAGHWERQDELACPSCKQYEQRVTELIREKFRFRCVRVENREERNQLEKVLVATIAACDLCRPSPEWLGRFCYSETVQASGLWNRHYVGRPAMTHGDANRFEQLIRETPGFANAGDLSNTLLLIPCSAGKKGAPDPGLASTCVSDFIGSEAKSLLEEGRREAFRRPGVTLDEDSPYKPALAYYSGQPYKTDDFRALLIEALRKGLHCLIISGGYGLLRAEEPIHKYSAHLPTQTLAIWRRRIPAILHDYVSRNGIEQVFGVFSSGYAAVVPDHLVSRDWREVPRFDVSTDSGNAQTVVPAKVANALLTLMRTELLGAEEPEHSRS